MEINIKVNTIDMYGISEIDNSEFKSVKYLTKDDIAFKIASMHGISIDEIKSDFSNELNKAYENNTNSFIKKQVIEQFKYNLGYILNGELNKLNKDDNPINKFDVNLSNKTIKKELNYETSVQWYIKNRGIGWANWISNYMYGKSDTKGDPFKFGDREKVTYLENIMLTIGSFNLNINYKGETHKWKIDYSKPEISYKKEPKRKNLKFKK